MKNSLLFLATGVLAAGLTAFGQTASPTGSQVLGRGRGGAPYAWNDKNKDGICDLTGKPVGQGRGQATGRSWHGRGRGPGMCSCCARNAPAAQATPTPAK